MKECEYNLKLLNQKTKREKNELNRIDISNITFFGDLILDSYSNDTGLDNIFVIFKSINNLLIIIYADDQQSIIVFDFVDNKKINKIKNAHSFYINNFRYYLDKINSRDLVISISSFDNNIKLWNINNLECLLNLKKVYKNGEIYSACFLYDKEILIASCNDYYPDKPDSIKIFHLKGKKLKVINNSNERTFFIDSFYDNKTDKNFIIVGNRFYVKAYDYNNNILFRKFLDKGYCEYHCCIIIYKNNNENITKLIESCQDGYIRIWNFHSGDLLKKLEILNKGMFRLYGICLWNNEYLFVGCGDKTIKLVNLNDGKIIKSLTGHYDFPLTIRKIRHPLYGECLITKGGEYDMIKLWGIPK